MPTEIEVRCDKCGGNRTTYNDVRSRSDAMIECKAKCYETHSRWSFVREVGQSSSVASPAAAVQPPVGLAASPNRRGESSSSSSSSSSGKGDRAKPRGNRNAFGNDEGRPSRSPGAGQHPREQQPHETHEAASKCCIVM
jgi:hypothetical protein